MARKPPGAVADKALQLVYAITGLGDANDVLPVEIERTPYINALLAQGWLREVDAETQAPVAPAPPVDDAPVDVLPPPSDMTAPVVSDPADGGKPSE